MTSEHAGGNYQQDRVHHHEQQQVETVLGTSGTPSSVVPHTSETLPIVGEEDAKAPKDRYYIVYLIFVLHGIGLLLPWNTFLNIAKDYFIDYKLANATGTEYSNHFFSYLSACSQLPNLLLNLLNLFVIVHGAGLVRRIIVSLILVAAICFFTILMIFIDSSTWPFGFFLLTMVSVVLLNSANGIYQNSIYGLCADFPFHFTNAVILGNNLCGTFISLLAILTILFSKDIKWAAFVYFGIAFITVLFCIFSFALLPKFPFYRFYMHKALRARKEKPTDGLLDDEMNGEASGYKNDNDSKPNKLATYVVIFKEIWRHLLDIFLVFFVTLALFPTVLVHIHLYSQERNYDLFVPKQLYYPIFVFLNFNLFAFLGSWLANYVQWPSPKHLNVVTIGRLVFLPLFWFCNYVPSKERTFPVLIQNEWAVAILIVMMALSHGFYSSLSMMYAPKVVHESKAQTVGMMAGFFLVLGVTAGVLFTFVESIMFS